jgi:hypothetical protein
VRTPADPRNPGPRDLASTRFARYGESLRLYWFCGERPGDRLDFDGVDLEIPQNLDHPVWVDLITGRAFEIPEDRIERRNGGITLLDVPLWDSPVLIARRAAVPLMID